MPHVKSHSVVYEHPAGTPLPEGAVDGMAEWLEEAEANGWEGEHVWDASVESPPHPWWKESMDKISVDRQDMIDEHEKLVGVLKSPDHADDLAEAKHQEKELKGYKRTP